MDLRGGGATRAEWQSEKDVLPENISEAESQKRCLHLLIRAEFKCLFPSPW